MFAIMLYCVLVLLIAVFMVSVAQALINMPALVIPTFGLIGVAVLLGLALERWYVPELIASPLAVFLAYFLIWVGYWLPISLPSFLGPHGVMAVWLVVLTAYCLLASVAPMWVLLRPRDFISGIKLAVGMVLGFAAIFVTHPVINAPMFEGAVSHGKPILANPVHPWWPAEPSAVSTPSFPPAPRPGSSTRKAMAAAWPSAACSWRAPWPHW